MRWAWLAVVITSCAAPSLSVEGKACGPGHPCGQGLLCNPFTLTCDTTATCARADGGVPPCAGADWYLGPAGSDTNAGTDPTTPRATLNKLTLYPGDRVHLLPGAYPNHLDTLVDTNFQHPMNSGSVQCPILLLGAPDGGTVLQSTLALSGSYVTIRDVTFSAQNDHGVRPHNITGMTLEHVTFRNVYGGPNAYLRDLWMTGSEGCAQCTVLDSDFFDTPPTVAVLGDLADNLMLRGNRFHLGDGDVLMLGGKAQVFADNDVTGRFTRVLLQFNATAGDGRVVRNVFHDMAPGGATVVSGAGQVLRNTFIRIPNGSTAADQGVFQDNLVAFMDNGLGQPLPAAGGYNLFDTVTKPYSDSTPQRAVSGNDLVGTALLDPLSFEPDAGSPAIDAADPALPVPPGGGARADIGARERGATLLPSGLYCLPTGAGEP